MNAVKDWLDTSRISSKISIKRKKIRKFKTKKELLSEKNAKISDAIILFEKGFNVKYIRKFLGITKDKLDYMITKKKGRKNILNRRWETFNKNSR